jgi:hypothetical protein
MQRLSTTITVTPKGRIINSCTVDYWTVFMLIMETQVSKAYNILKKGNLPFKKFIMSFQLICTQLLLGILVPSTSSLGSSSMQNISHAHQISLSMQSVGAASCDSMFPITSTIGLQVLMSWLRHAQYSGSAMTVLIMLGGTGDRLLVFFLCIRLNTNSAK